MISFKELDGENAESVCRLLSENLSEEASGFLCELIAGIATDDEDVTYAVSVFSSCLLVRIFDMGRYLFVYPCELDGNADLKAAIDAVGEYAKREEIPLVFVDVPGELLSTLAGYRHVDLDADDPDGSVYRVRIKTECELTDEIPTVSGGRVELTPLSEEDVSQYAELCKDKNVNKYWGYDYSEDVKDPSDRYFFETAASDFARGASMTMAVRADGEFVGEAILYAFDGKGGAEFAIRILPHRQRMGLGTEAVGCIAELSRRIGLVRLYARVMKKNAPSIAMLNRLADASFEDGEHLIFEIEI